MTRAIALPLICAVAALTAAGCGESAGAGGDADPAALVPASAPIYAEAAVQPTGERREDALAAAGKLLRTGDPAGKLRQLIDDGLAENGGGLTWEKDFAPWLGEDAGVWASNLEAPEPSWAVIVATKDAGAAETALGRFREDDPDATYTDRSYDGVDYAVDSERVANGVIDDFVVIGTEDAFKRTADMRDEGEALADADRYKDAVGDLDDESLGHYYMDLRPVFEAALKQDPATAAQLEQFKSVLPFDQLGPITGAFEADADGMSLDTVLTGVPEGPFRDLAKLWSGSEAELLAGLPGDAWGALAIPGLGEAAESTINSFARRDRRGGGRRAGQAGDRARPLAGHLLLGRRRRRLRPRRRRGLARRRARDPGDGRRQGRDGVRQADRADRQAVRRGAAAGEGRRRGRGVRPARDRRRQADRDGARRGPRGRRLRRRGDDRRAGGRRRARRLRALRRREGRARRRRVAVVPALDAGGDHARRRDGRDRPRLRGGAALPRDARLDRHGREEPTATASSRGSRSR